MMTAPVNAGYPSENEGMGTYNSHEVVGLFKNEEALEAAFDALTLAGFDRAKISILGNLGQAHEKYGVDISNESADHLADDARAPEAGYASSDSRTELEAAAVSVPIYIVGVGSLAVVIASGGSLAFALAALMLGGAAGGGIGGLIARGIAHKHRKHIAEGLRQGGLLLWVQVDNLEEENKALAILRQNNAYHVHTHEISRSWGIRDVPFWDAEPDPLLVHKR